MFEKYIDNADSLVIAEIGQNHQGDLSIALEMIEVFSSRGATAVKFQARNNKFLFDEAVYNRSYDSENSFGPTYGAHREALELSAEDFAVIRAKCESIGVLFCVTAFDAYSVDMIAEVGVDFFKLASFDLGNLPLIKKVAETQKPVVLSTGGGRLDHITATVKFLEHLDVESCVLHCVSKYPCEPQELALRTISELKNMFPNVAIGLSDHFNGILSGPLAYMLGARVFEKHVTLNRAWRGTDHVFSLAPEAFQRFVRDIKRASLMLDGRPFDTKGDEPVFKKLGKSMVYSNDRKHGDVLQLDDVDGKICTDEGIPIRECFRYIGKRLKVGVRAGEKIYDEHFR
jgi:sialic acid synthase